MADSDDPTLPRATIYKMVRDFMPADLRIANDTIDMMVECCTEFIQLVSSEANEFSTREGKNTITAEHVIKSLEELGFAELLPEVRKTLEDFKQEAKVTSTHKASLRKTGAEHAGLTEEQQIALQQKMFADARARSITSCDAAAAMATTYQQQLALHAQQQQQLQQLQEQQLQPQQPDEGEGGAAGGAGAGQGDEEGPDEDMDD